MIKTTITETTEKFDKEGNLVEKITRTETTEDDETRFPPISTTPYFIETEPTCKTTLL